MDEQTNSRNIVTRIFNIRRFDEFFIGREAFFKQIDTKLLNEEDTFSVQALVGLGGVGKTSIARKYAYDNINKYNLIWWFNAEDKTVLKNEFIELARALQIDISNYQEISSIRYNIDIKLNQIKKCLFIFDNVDEYGDVKDYLCSRAKVLITSRNRKLKGIRKQNTIDIYVLNDKEAKEFILKRLEIESNQENNKLAQELATLVGCLPLALEQCIAYIENDPSINLNKYIELFKEYSKANQLSYYFNEHEMPENYHHKLTVTWKITFDKIKSLNNYVLPFMYICALLSPEKIPYSLFEQNSNYLEDSFSSTKNENITVKNTVKNVFVNFLYRYSIIQWDSTDSTIMMHRLLQHIIREELKNKNLINQYETHVLLLIYESFDFNEDSETWAFCNSIYPHAKYILERTMFSEEQTVMNYRSALYHKLSRYSYNVLSMKEAKDYLIKAMEIEDVLFPDNDLVKETNLNNLGNILEMLGELEDSKSVLLECLELNMKSHKEPHEAIATTLNNIGLLYLKMNSLNEAKMKFNKALDMDIILFGEYSQDVFTDLNNLGLVETKLKNSEAAKQYFEKALKIGQKCFEVENIKMAKVYRNLSPILFKLGDIKGAVYNLEKSVDILSRLYGSDDKRVVDGLFLLAATISSININSAVEKYEEAISRVENVCIKYEDYEKEILKYIEDLGLLYLELERFKDAKVIFIKAYKIVVKYFQYDVELNEICLRYLAKAYFELKDYENCALELEKLMSFGESRDFKTNINYIEDIKGLALVYLKLEVYDKAIEYYSKLITIVENIDPVDYQSVIDYLSIVCNLFANLKMYDEALEKRELALSYTNKMYGSLSIKNIIHLNNIGYINSLKGNTQEAKNSYEIAIRIIEISNESEDIAHESNIVDVYLNYGDLLRDENNFNDAKTNYDKALKISLNKKMDKKVIKKCYIAFAQLSTVQNNIDDVIDYFKTILSIDKQVYGPVNEEVDSDLQIIIRALIKVKKLTEAIPYIEERIGVIAKMYGEESKKYIEISNILLKIKEKHNKHFKGEELMSEVYISREEAEKLAKEYKILIITATDIETRHLFNKLKPAPGKKELLITNIGAHTYTIATLGVFPIIHVQTEPGTTMTGASLITTQDAIKFWEPKILIMVGIAFGMDNLKQKIGDVLVSKYVIPYEIEKINEDKSGNQIKIRRNPIVEAGSILYDRFRNIRNWSYTLSSGENSQIVPGQILSGEKLVNSSQFKEQLICEYPEAIGGEMEATGVYVAAKSCNFSEWIVVKGICDWADGNKDIEKEKNQIEAIQAAVALCEKVFSNPYNFEDMNVKSIS